MSENAVICPVCHREMEINCIEENEICYDDEVKQIQYGAYYICECGWSSPYGFGDTEEACITSATEKALWRPDKKKWEKEEE